jgi:hypothetical protein
MPEVHNMVKVPGKWLVIAHSVRKIYTPVTRTWIMNLAHETAQERKYYANNLLALRVAVRYHIDFLHIMKQRD